MASYLDKAARSRDPRFAQILERIGYGRRDMRADPATGYLRSDMQASGDTLEELRTAYQALKGRAPAASWDAAKIRRLIGEAQS